jgi:uncharacterized protein (TIGR02284 family)
MADHTEHAALNNLIETCRDAEQGFRTASEHVRDPYVRALFREMSTRHASFAAALLPHAQRLGGNAPSEGTHGGALHRNWIELKSKLAGNADGPVIAEAQRGARYTVNTFWTAMEGMLPPDARELVEQQYADIRTAQVRIDALA